MRFSAVLAIGCLVVAVFPQTDASPTHPLNVEALTSASSLIVVGQVIDVKEGAHGSFTSLGPTIGGNQMMATLQIDRVLKGICSAKDLDIEFFRPDAPVGLAVPSIGEYAMFFLTETADADKPRFTDPLYGWLPASHGVKIPAGDALTRVVLTLAEEASASSAPDPRSARALDVLASVSTDLATQALEDTMNKSVGDLRLLVAAKLLSRNDLVALPVVTNALIHPGGISQNLHDALAGALAGIRDAKAIPSLVAILQTGNPDVRRWCAVALRQTGSPSALEPLAELLNDPDDTTRYYAVVAMGEITHQDEWTPSISAFRANEAHYLVHWRGWASTNLQ